MHAYLSRGLAIEATDKSALGRFERIRRHYVGRAARRQLHTMDDRMLHDIGIARGDIDRLTKG